MGYQGLLLFLNEGEFYLKNASNIISALPHLLWDTEHYAENASKNNVLIMCESLKRQKPKQNKERKKTNNQVTR